MNLKLIRKWYTPHSTEGELQINDVFQCYTLEDTSRLVKVENQTCIPAGTYNVIITPSNRFRNPDGSKRDMPLVENVPNFEGIRIHSGNTDADTEGCILVGTVRNEDEILESRVAFNFIFTKLQSALALGETVTLKIVDTFKPLT